MKFFIPILVHTPIPPSILLFKREKPTKSRATCGIENLQHVIHDPLTHHERSSAKHAILYPNPCTSVQPFVNSPYRLGLLLSSCGGCAIIIGH